MKSHLIRLPAGSLVTASAMAAVAVFVAVWVPSPLPAQVNCADAGHNWPAEPVPECVDAQGFAVACDTPGRVRLWPTTGIRPASDIPRIRDSTDWIGRTFPGRNSGHELFSSVDIVTVEGISRRLYVAYGAGIQAWDIETDPANPIRRDSRDGWQSEFLTFGSFLDGLDYVEDIDAVNVSSTLDVVAVAGLEPVGVSFWEFDTTTNSFQYLYQDTDISAHQVRLIELNDGTLYAIVGSDQGVAVYNVTAARALASPCLDSQGTVCPGVFRGDVAPQARRYVDAIHVPGSDHVFVSSSEGRFSYLELWELADPQSPATAVLRMSELLHSHGSALFRYLGHDYLGVVREADGLDQGELRILLIDGCVQGSICSLANGTLKEAVLPIALTGYPTTHDFLTYSSFKGAPYLYYGFATADIEGSDREQLFELGALQVPSPDPLPGLPEVTAGGDSYSDPCNGSTTRYWSHYYSGNTHGLNNMVPRIGKLSSGGYFYRAAIAILDVHLVPPPPRIFSDGFETGDVTAWSQAVNPN